MREKCSGVTKTGAPCGSFCVSGSEFCYTHDPKLAEVRRETQSEGGRRSGELRRLRRTYKQLKTADQLAEFLAQTVQDVRSGVVRPETGRVLAYSVGILRALHETADLERRIEALEQGI